MYTQTQLCASSWSVLSSSHCDKNRYFSTAPRIQDGRLRVGREDSPSCLFRLIHMFRSLAPLAASLYLLSLPPLFLSQSLHLYVSLSRISSVSLLCMHGLFLSFALPRSALVSRIFVTSDVAERRNAGPMRRILFFFLPPSTPPPLNLFHKPVGAIRARDLDFFHFIL